MNPKNTTLHYISVHEAGHVIANVVLGRGVKEVLIDPDGKSGQCCYDECDEWNQFFETSVLLSGPRAQIELCSKSLPTKKVRRFKDRIVYQSDKPGMFPEIYNSTGWQHDVGPILSKLTKPGWPAGSDLPLLLTIGEVIETAENRVKCFIGDSRTQEAIKEIACELEKDRVLRRDDISNLLSGMDLSGLKMDYFNWPK